MDYLECEELAALVLANGDEDKAEDILEKEEEVENLLYEELEISFDQFMSVAEKLIMFTPKVQSPLTGNVYHAFVNNGVAIAKQECEE